MSETNTIVSNAVAQINEARRKSVEQAAACLIQNITDEQRHIAGFRKAIEASQARLAELRSDVFTQAQALGAEMSAPLNANEVTIARAIETLNADRQKLVDTKAKIELDLISSYEGSIAAVNQKIAGYRKQIGELKVEEVSADIAG